MTDVTDRHRGTAERVFDTLCYMYGETQRGSAVSFIAMGIADTEQAIAEAAERRAAHYDRLSQGGFPPQILADYAAMARGLRWHAALVRSGDYRTTEGGEGEP